MPQPFSSQLDIKLINLVKNNPVLYNPRHPKYSDSDAREVTWQKIGDALNKPTAEFAGIQCHIQFGDYNEEKHKPGFIENLNEYLPEQYCSSWGIEKKVLKEFSSRVGLSELDAKHLYIKTARALPTYGVTFFLVKEKQKGKKKLVPRLLGINAEAILRLDECTKEILQQWPLTHVKTYHAGKGETFTLNFGDYVDKEYSVKTRDAFRIRDILEGYIDLIRKRMLANYNRSQDEEGYLTVDSVGCGQSSMVQHISNSPMKIVEQTYVGPSKIVEYEPGQTPSQGAQAGSAQQMVISELINKQGQGLKSEVPMRKDMGIPFARRLNRLNSNSVKIVTLLTEPSQAHIEDAKKIVDVMNADLPFVRDGVKEAIAKQSSEEEKKKLQDQLHELDELMKLLSQNTEPAAANPTEADDAAKQIADLTTQMYFAIAPEPKRRSRILSKSRDSFIADERTEKSLRRASFIAASAGANHAIDNAHDILQQEYKGPALTAEQIEELERSAIDKLGKINAAIAHYLLAHSDPQNIDYATAVNSLNTIHELTPELAKDGQALASMRDGKDRRELLKDIKELCAAAKHVCSLSGVEDTEKLQEASAKYADVAGKLVYVLGRRSKPRADKENEIVNLAKEASAKTASLVSSARELGVQAGAEPGAAALAAAGDTAIARAQDLVAQAVLNAPTISEPHCQSAVTAAAEALSSSAQQLAAAWRPLAEPPGRRPAAEALHRGAMDLAAALDRLRGAYGPGGDASEPVDPGSEAQRLKFINSLTRVGGSLQDAEDDLSKPLTAEVAAAQAAEAERRLAQRLAQLNAALAALLGATADRSNPDYATADAAAATITELMPELVKDSKIASANKDDAAKAALLDNIKDLCAVSKNVCASAYGAKPEDLNDAVSKYAAASGKLTYVVNRRANPGRESQIIEQASAACNQASVLLSGVQQLTEGEGEGEGVTRARGELDARGAELAAAAQALLTTAQLTSPCISDPRCQSALLSAAELVSTSGAALAAAWAPLVAGAEREARGGALRGARGQMEARLERLRGMCRDQEEQPVAQECQLTDGQDAEDGPQQQQKLKFIMTMNGAKGKLAEAQKELDKPTVLAKGSDVDKVQQRLSQALAQLNAAIAALLAATADSDKPDYVAAEQAANTITKLMPQVIQDTKTVSAGKDEPTRAAMLAQVKEICEANEAICANSDGSNAQGLNDAVAKLINASGKLVFVVSPRVNPHKEQEIIKLSSAACSATSDLLSGVQQLAEGVGGERGQELDTRGGRVADAAQALLQTAQLTAPSLPSPHSQRALLSSADGLSTAGQALAASLAPLQDSKHVDGVGELQAALQRLEGRVEALRAACLAPVAETEVTPDPQNQQKLQFIKTMKAARGKLEDSQREFNKPTMPGKGTDVDKVQQRLSQALAQLNAAIAALLAATADRENPDYVAAQKAATIISELTPQVIQDTKTVSAGKDEPTRAAMLAQMKEICDASEGICAGFDGTNPEGLNDAVAKYTDASGKLVYVVSSKVNPDRENKIIDLSSAACSATSGLLSGVQQLAEGVGGERGQELDTRGGRVADAAQALLQTAMITSPSISAPECQEALLSSVDNLSSTGQQLAASLAPLLDDKQHKQRVENALEALKQLDDQLDELRKACKEPDLQDSVQEQQKQQFIKTLQGTKEKWAVAHKELKKPTTPARGADMETIQLRLSQRLGELNAAIAALLSATADRDKPRYAEAENLVNTITNLMPHIIQDTKTVSADKDEPIRVTMMAQMKEICAASEGICGAVDGSHTEDLNDAVGKFTDASGKLVYVVNPRANPRKEEEIINLSSAACSATSDLLSGVQQLAEGVGGERGQELDTRGGRVADAAQALLQTAMITAPSMSSPQCQEALISSADDLSSAGHSLAACLDDLHDDKHSQQAQQLKLALQRLQAQLDALRKACRTHDAPPPLPSQPPPAAPAARAVRKRSSADVTQDFLERLRIEESLAQSPHNPPASPTTHATTPSVISKVEKIKPPPPARKTDDDKQLCKLHQMFVDSVDDAERSIKENEASLMKLCKSPSSGPAVSQREMLRRQGVLQRALALAGVEVANLVGANYADKIDYTAATKATKALPCLLNSIVEEGAHLSDNVNEMARKALLYDLLQLNGAAKELCRAAKTDRQNLNEAAVNFGDASTKLLYVVSSDVDPELEKEIISRAKTIGDSASRLALDAAGLATAPAGSADVQGICDAGTACVDAAGKLVYTAKLTAPSIHEPACQAALAASADALSARLKSFTNTWEPLASDDQQAKTVSELKKEASTLEQRVAGLRSDVRGGRGARGEAARRTPLGEGARAVLRGAQMCAESPELQAPRQIEYAAYADRLKEAVLAVDIAYERSDKSPHDTNKRRELEGAIQNLQMTLLQSRPKRGDKGDSNIVDLRDFIEEVSSEAQNMRSAVNGVAVSTARDKKALEEIKEKCEKIEAKASKVMYVDTRADLESTYNDILEVDQLGQECEDLIKEINSSLKEMEDAKAKRLLLSKMLPLSESCNLLRFATKSGISAAACATLDSSLDDLDDIEDRVITSIVKDAGSAGVTLRPKQPLLSGDSPATISLCREVASASTGVSAAAVTAYIADAAARVDTASPGERNKLLKHLYKLVHLLKSLTATSSRRAATWQPSDGPELASITEQIIQEIYNPESKFGVQADEPKHRILSESDIAKLLIPAAPKILGDKKLQEDKLAQLSGKLSSMCGLVSAGVTSPPALARSARAAADAAAELDGIARGVHITDHIQKKKVDEAAKEMSFATYNVLKTAESACQDPNNSILRRKLVLSCETLNKSIDKLISTASTATPLAKTTSALSRAAALQLSALAPRATVPTPFNDTCDLLTQQADNIYKIKSDAPMPRAEFMRHLDELGSAVRVSTDCAAQCAYFIAVSEKHRDIAKTGLVDVPQIQKSIESIQDSCMAIIGACQVEQAKEQKDELQKRVQDLSGALDKAHMMVTDGEVKRTLLRARSCVCDAADDLGGDLDAGDMANITPKAVNLLEAVNQAHCMIEKCPLVPVVGDMSPDTKAKCDEVMDHSKALLSNTLALLKDVNSSPEDEEVLTWVTYSISRRKLLEAYDELVKTVKKNGNEAGIYEKSPEEEKEEPAKKSYLEIQVDLANSWLKRPACKPEAKAIGQQAVRNVVDMARQLSEDLKGTEREEVRNVIAETEQLLCECGRKYDQEKNSLLMDHLKELRKCIRRGAVTRVVEDFVEAEAPLADLEILADSETDENKRKFILERKIASLLAQLGRVTRTARFVAGASTHHTLGGELTHCSEQTELLAPMLVQAAQQRIDHPDDKAVIEKYKTLLAQYADSIARVRDLCDRAVDPMEFVQAAGDTMQRMREDMTQHNNDPQKCAYASSAITRLANRVIHVGMSSSAVQTDPELRRALQSAQQRLHAAAPAHHTRASRLPDWRENTAEILRTALDVESALGGEDIFKREQTTANQPIYSVARSLHESVREWSARDNEIVAVARRMAVLMARLSDYMEADKQQELIATSKSIVRESHEVADLAKKLAHECTDLRIKTNLLQTCERIPTISGQLKMLTTVKGSSLGHQGSEADKEAMDMLVVNAQSLMMSIQEVVKAAAGASVKIMSQRGPRLRWVRKNYY